MVAEHLRRNSKYDYKPLPMSTAVPQTMWGRPGGRRRAVFAKTLLAGFALAISLALLATQLRGPRYIRSREWSCLVLSSKTA